MKKIKAIQQHQRKVKERLFDPTVCSIQGSLFLPAQVQKVFQGKNLLQEDKDYLTIPGLVLNNEISRAWGISLAAWKEYKNETSRGDLEEEEKLKITKNFARLLFKEALGYELESANSYEENGSSFVLDWMANGSYPISVSSASYSQDTRQSRFVTVQSLAGKSVFQNIQELVNSSSKFTWGLSFNGETVRLVRDSISLSSPSYIEFSLKDIFSAENYSEFHNLYLFLHASRTKILNERNAWDEWIKAGIDEGQPAREELSKSIKTALQILGEGFLSNPLNSKLREDLQEKKLSKEDFLKELLRLMYRFLFIFCVEERELINPNSNSSQDREAKVRYWKGYSFHRFKDKALKSYFQNEFSDAWDSVRVVFKGLEKGEKFIGLPALGGLFDSSQCKNLVESTLDNRHFYRAMKLMRWATLNGVFSSVDYKNMGTEELGSIYESLLELVPIIKIESQEFYFAQEDKGDNARKDTGSYYTPDVLVRHLIKTALVPVIEGKLFNNPSNPEEALLDLKVIDPSCGSGHFLLGASRTIAHYLAKVRAKGEVVTPDLYRVALRDVISHCIYGVDVNELSIELARMALWLEGFNGDLPLSFLDHHLKVGNSLVGILDSSILKQGIPNSRYRSTLGDEQAISFLAKENKSGHNTLKKLLSDKESSLLPTFEVLIPEIESFEALTSKNIFEEREKKNKYHEIKSKIESSRLKKLCDMWMCGFLSMKRDEVQNKIPTTKDLVAFLMDLPSEGRDLNSIVEFSTEFCRKNQIFHWPLEFLSVFENNKGFDCVLGNPPWDVPVLKEVAWFANKVPTIATAKTSAERKKMIRALEDGKFSVSYAGVEENSPTLVDEEKRLFREFKDELEKVKNENAFLKLKEGRYKLTSGNYYAYFAELCTSIVKEGGGVGLITPQDLVTTESTKRFAEWAFNGKLRSFYHFENREKFFPIDGRYNFALFTFLPSTKTESVLYARKIEDLDDPNRNVDLVPADLKEINPNTQTAFLPRSKKDLELLKKIYTASPIFIRDPEDGDPGSNAWKASLSSPFHMSQDSGLFSEEQLPGYVPLYEGKNDTSI